MPTATEELLIIVRLKDAASAGIRGMSKTLAGSRKVISSISNAVFSLQGALIGLGAGLLARQFLSVASSFEQMEMQLEQLTKGKGRETLEEINDWAKRMPVDTAQAVSSFITMQAFGLDPTIEKLETLVDIATIMGQDALPRVSRSLGQMAALGKLSAEELNQLSEVGINARKILKDAFGQTVEELQKSGKDINEIIDAIWAGLAGEFGGASAKAINTWQGVITVLISYWKDFLKEVMQRGVFDFLKGGLREVIDLVEDLEKSGNIDEIIVAASENIVTALKRIGFAIGVVGLVWDGWNMIWLGLKLAWEGFVVSLLAGAEALGRAAHLWQLLFGDDEGVKEAKKHLDGVRERQEQWTKALVETNKELVELAGKESSLSKIDNILEKIEKRSVKIRLERELADEGLAFEAFAVAPEVKEEVVPEPTLAPPTAITQATAEAAEFKALSQTQLAILEQQYDEGEKNLNEFYDERFRIIIQGFEKEKAVLEEREKLAKGKPDKLLAIQAQQFVMEQEHQRDLLGLTQWRLDQEEALEENQTDILKEERDRRIREIAASQVGGAAGLSTQFQQELLELDYRHAEELTRLKDLKADQDQIEDAHRVQQLEKDKLLADQRARLYDSILAAASKTTGDIAASFKALYETGGKNAKAFYRIYKAAAITQAIIDTYTSATAVYRSMAAIPYVGHALGIAAAAAAIAGGMARVATIRAQQFARGGLVQPVKDITTAVFDKMTVEKLVGAKPDKPIAFQTGGVIPGSSPHPRADNIPIMATAGEFVHPVDTVKHYGMQAMEAIRKKAIPKDVLSQFNISLPSLQNKMHFQAGGAVPSGAGVSSSRPAAPPTGGGGRQAEAGEGINITNITDPNLMGQYLSSRPGEQQILNIISEQKHVVKSSLFEREG